MSAYQIQFRCVQTVRQASALALRNGKIAILDNLAVKQRLTGRIDLIESPQTRREQAFCSAVAEGLSKSQKRLPCRYFYDLIGSQLFEQICDLPEYYLTRTEQTILENHAPNIIQSIGHETAMVEFGSGNSVKTRLLVDAALDCQERLHYIPIDISSKFLKNAARALIDDYDRLSITAIAAEYTDALSLIPDHDQPHLFLFIGSNIGNFNQSEAIAFITQIRQQMTPPDRLLVSFDLEKSHQIIEAAYNDATGVTAAFNKNLLTRINRELDADFVLAQFEHFAPFLKTRSRIEMRLISQCPQKVYIKKLKKEFTFQKGEYIHTEHSHKYTFEAFSQICNAAGLAIEQQWRDEREWFAIALLKPQEGYDRT